MLDHTGQWVAAADPLHFDKPKVAGVGLGKTFAIDYAQQHPDVVVGLIPCAVGGSPIASWQPGGYHSQTMTYPYDDAISRASLAMQSGTLKGILWHQGESDSNAGAADVYGDKLQALVSRLRLDLDAADVPFIAGQMGQFEGRPWNDHKKRVDAAQRSLAETVPLTAFVSSNGLTDKGDQVHFDSRSYRELGHRYFNAYETMLGERADNPLGFDVERTVAHQGFDGEMCWVHARAGVIPAQQAPSKQPLVVMTTQPLMLTGSDVFYALHHTLSTDFGTTWSELERNESFARQVMEDGREVTVCDFTPMWHAKTGKLLGTGHTVWYEQNRVAHIRPVRHGLRGV